MLMTEQSKKEQNKKPLIIGIIVAIIAIVATIATVILLSRGGEQAQKSNYSIHFYEGNMAYYMDVKDDKIHVEEREVIVCIQAPCDPIKKGEYTVEYKPEYRTLFETIYENFEKQGDFIRIGSSDDTVSPEIIKQLQEIVNSK